MATTFIKSRQLLQRAASQLRTFGSTSSNSSPIYELRIYSVYPSQVASLVGLSKKWIHLRTEKSKLVGYWFSDLGGINDAIHLWEYDDLDHRASVRRELAASDQWQKNYIAKVMPMWYKQDNCIMNLKEGTQLNTSQIEPGGVYEIQALSGNAELDPVPEGTLTIGEFNVIVGQVGQNIRLLHHSSPNKALQLSQKSLAGVKTGTVQNRMLTPAPWSPLQ